MSANQDLGNKSSQWHYYETVYGKIALNGMFFFHEFLGEKRSRKLFERSIKSMQWILGENRSKKIFMSSKVYLRKISGEKSSITPFNSKDSTLYSFYDLSTVNPTFNFLQYIVLSEFYRIQKGLQYNHICIVPSESNKISTILYPDDSSVLTKDIQWRIMTMILPTIFLFNSYSGMTLFNSRDEANNFIHSIPKNVFPQNYRVDFPISTFTTYTPLNNIADEGYNLPDLKSHRKADVLVDEWLENNCSGKKVLTITIRECIYLKERNSNISLYADFISKLNRDQFAVVILRDTERIFSPAPGEFQKLSLLYFDPSNLHMRLAMYEKAYLNIGDSGPFILCFHNKRIRALWVGLDKEFNFQTDTDFIRGGYRIGENLPFMGPFQKIIWDRNNETLYGEFLKLSKKIDLMDNIHQHS